MAAYLRTGCAAGLALVCMCACGDAPETVPEPRRLGVSGQETRPTGALGPVLIRNGGFEAAHAVGGEVSRDDGFGV